MTATPFESVPQAPQATVTQQPSASDRLGPPRAVDGSVLDKRIALIDLVDTDSFREVMATLMPTR